MALTGGITRLWRRRGAALLAVGLAIGSFATAVAPATQASAQVTGLPPGFVDELVVGGLPYPTAVAFSPTGTTFVALKRGEVRVYNGTTALGTFVDVNARVHDNHDRGLLGLAVHPEFPAQPYLYLLYTHDARPAGVAADLDSPVQGRTAQLLRVTADPAPSGAQPYSRAIAGSEVVLLGRNSVLANIGNPGAGRDTSTASCMSPKTMSGTPVQDCIPSDENSHTIGTLTFGPDGSLFVSSGDGSNYGGVDPRALRAQLLDSLAGKVLRIDPITGAGLPDNPYFEESNPNSNRSKVYARGLRNPFRMTVDPVSGEAFIGDVGWSTWEEINTGKGANFGWPCYEGGSTITPESGSTRSLQQSSYRGNPATYATCNALYAQGVTAVRAPVFAYDHSVSSASANGGAFYGGTTWPAQYRGALFIADYNRRWIRYLTLDAQGRATVNNFGTGSSGPVQVLAGPDTNLYVMMYDSSGGQLRRIRYTGAGNTPPTAIVEAAPTIGMTPLTVTFDANATFDPDAQALSYNWNFADGSSSTTKNPTHTYVEAGVYDATLTVRELTSPFASSTATVRITVGNNPPLAEIIGPEDGTTYRVGDTIDFSGRATAGGTPVPASQLSWELRHRHNEHVHYSTPTFDADASDPTVSSGSFLVDDHGDTTSFGLCLTATVDGDVTDTQCVDLQPEKAEIAVDSDPPGMLFSYEDEGLELATPAILTPIIGSTQTVSLEPIQQSRSFVRWSDGVTTPSRTFTVNAPASYTAQFANTQPVAALSALDPVTGQGPLTVRFAGSGSSDAEGDALTYAWDAGAAGTSSAPSPTFTFGSVGTHTVRLTVTDQLGATGTATMTVTVTAPALPTVLPGAGAVTEGNGGTKTLNLGVRLSASSTQAVTVQWTTLQLAGAPLADGANDYVPTGGAVTFQPGETSKTVPIAINGDMTDEPDEQVWVSWHSPTNAVIGGFYGLGYGTIGNDDPPTSVVPGGATVVEGDAGTTQLQIPVSLSVPSGKTVTVEWATAPATGASYASAPADYTPASGTVTFAPGQLTKTVAVTVRGDTLVEPNEWVIVPFGKQTNAVMGGVWGLGFGAIVNDD